jgi:hypothetical protein
MKSDVNLGYGIILTPECIKKLKHAEVYPIGLQHQQTIDEHGNIIPKKRISHDLSNRRNISLSINQRVQDELLPSVLYTGTASYDTYTSYTTYNNTTQDNTSYATR